MSKIINECCGEMHKLLHFCHFDELIWCCQNIKLGRFLPFLWDHISQLNINLRFWGLFWRFWYWSTISDSLSFGQIVASHQNRQLTCPFYVSVQTCSNYCKRISTTKPDLKSSHLYARLLESYYSFVILTQNHVHNYSKSVWMWKTYRCEGPRCHDIVYTYIIVLKCTVNSIYHILSYILLFNFFNIKTLEEWHRHYKRVQFLTFICTLWWR